MSGKLSRIHKLVKQIAIATKELNEISVQVPSCEKCGGVDLEDRGYMYKCNGCKHLTPRIITKYVRMPK